MNIFISGSLAYDVIMNFPDQFTNHIIKDKLHALSVSFTIDTLHKNFGGTAGNIAFSFSVLGMQPLIAAPLGNDGKRYRTYLSERGIPDTYIGEESVPTAIAHIITDESNNQIAAFYPGALVHAASYSLNKITETCALAIIAPNTNDAMVKHAQEAVEHGVPYVFDPGQQITQLSSEDIQGIIGHASFVVANDYEWSLIQKKSGISEEEIVALPQLKAAIVTLGERGSRILVHGEEGLIVPAGTTENFIDPTGAGDAYRAGFFTAYLQGHPFTVCAQAGNIAALFAIEYHGTQNPEFSLESFRTRFEEVYETKAPL